MRFDAPEYEKELSEDEEDDVDMKKLAMKQKM